MAIEKYVNLLELLTAHHIHIHRFHIMNALAIFVFHSNFPMPIRNFDREFNLALKYLDRNVDNLT